MNMSPIHVLGPDLHEIKLEERKTTFRDSLCDLRRQVKEVSACAHRGGRTGEGEGTHTQAYSPPGSPVIISPEPQLPKDPSCAVVL